MRRRSLWSRATLRQRLALTRSGEPRQDRHSNYAKTHEKRAMHIRPRYHYQGQNEQGPPRSTRPASCFEEQYEGHQGQHLRSERESDVDQWQCEDRAQPGKRRRRTGPTTAGVKKRGKRSPPPPRVRARPRACPAAREAIQLWQD